MSQTTLFPAAALDGVHAVGARMPDAAGVVWEHEGGGVWKAPAIGRRCEIGHEDARLVEVRELLDGYFRHTLRLDLDEDIPACAADIVKLRGRWVAEALESAAEQITERCGHKDYRERGAGGSFEGRWREPKVWLPDQCPFCSKDTGHLRVLAAEYRAGTW